MSSSISNAEQAADWARMLARFTPTVRTKVSGLAQRHHTALAHGFYDAMLQEPSAARFLSHEQVHTGLLASMERWVIQVLSAGPDDDLESLVARQAHIGEMHARIELPVHLVLRGARCLKNHIHALLLQRTERMTAMERASASWMATQVIDQAMEVMSQAYDGSRDRRSRAKEAYRLFAVTQNAATERGRYRAALLVWESQCIFDYAVGLPAEQLPRLAGSEFGLWFRHKGAYVFQGTHETALILQAIQQIDEVLLPRMNQGGEMVRANNEPQLRALREQTRLIALHLDTLFAQSSELEAGRDALTSLLNRKFLSVVMGKELAFARDHHSTFSVLSIDVDHFKAINDSLGHDGGDAVLQHLAVVMTEYCRSGDYLFRMGGEEFLLLLVDCKPHDAERVANKLRDAVAKEPFRLPGERQHAVTVSIGVASFSGHPDYQSLLKRADEALYQAKKAGRNRVVLAC